MRFAIVHYWLLGMRGGERVVEALCRLLPEADIFTIFYDPEAVSPLIRSRKVTASVLNPLRKHYRNLLPLMPAALEHLDLRGYDVVISSESGPAKGVITSSRTWHISYCHSPMRYLWDLYPDYLHDWTKSRVRKAVMAAFSNYLRVWDFASAARVDAFIANSGNVQGRIWKTYRRRSEVIYPPVAVESFYHKPADDYYLVVSELVAYKRISDAICCAGRMNRKLKIVGDGPEYKRLKANARAHAEFCGRVTPQQLRELYSRTRAVLIPGEEDFGIVAVEAIASGKPVIALGRGGVLEIALAEQPRSGFFYDEPGAESLEKAIRRFERLECTMSPLAIQASAARFSEERFAEAMGQVIWQQGPQRICDQHPVWFKTQCASTTRSPDRD